MKIARNNYLLRTAKPPHWLCSVITFQPIELESC